MRLLHNFDLSPLNRLLIPKIPARWIRTCGSAAQSAADMFHCSRAVVLQNSCSGDVTRISLSPRRGRPRSCSLLRSPPPPPFLRFQDGRGARICGGKAPSNGQTGKYMKWVVQRQIDFPKSVLFLLFSQPRHMEKIPWQTTDEKKAK